MHIEDVASDDNGQDLRWSAAECMSWVAEVSVSGGEFKAGRG